MEAQFAQKTGTEKAPEMQQEPEMDQELKAAEAVDQINDADMALPLNEAISDTDADFMSDAESAIENMEKLPSIEDFQREIASNKLKKHVKMLKKDDNMEKAQNLVETIESSFEMVKKDLGHVQMSRQEKNAAVFVAAAEKEFQQARVLMGGGTQESVEARMESTGLDRPSVARQYAKEELSKVDSEKAVEHLKKAGKLINLAHQATAEVAQERGDKYLEAAVRVKQLDDSITEVAGYLGPVGAVYSAGKTGAEVFTGLGDVKGSVSNAVKDATKEYEMQAKFTDTENYTGPAAESVASEDTAKKGVVAQGVAAEAGKSTKLAKTGGFASIYSNVSKNLSTGKAGKIFDAVENVATKAEPLGKMVGGAGTILTAKGVVDDQMNLNKFNAAKESAEATERFGGNSMDEIAGAVAK